MAVSELQATRGLVRSQANGLRIMRQSIKQAQRRIQIQTMQDLTPSLIINNQQHLLEDHEGDHKEDQTDQGDHKEVQEDLEDQKEIMEVQGGDQKLHAEEETQNTKMR